MQHYSKWSWEEKQKLIIKIVEWAQKNHKNVWSLNKEDILEAIANK